MEVQLWTLIPFLLMLLSIAIIPLVAEHWWESNRNKLIVSLILGVPTAIYLICVGLGHNLEHQMLFDYVPFIILLCALFVVTGGIHIGGDIEAKPATNTALLALGWVLASIMGTTGAAMLLIRPLIEINKERKYKVHTILFFIALVANCGGLLTPLGDPPLFLLYLRGAEFTWFLSMLPQWAFVGAMLLVLFFITDSYYHKREPQVNLKLDATQKEPIHITGTLNFVWLVGVVASVAFLNQSYIPAMGEHDAPLYIKFLREIALVVLIVLSLVTTKKEVRKANHYSWEPIIEVAVLFFGIFITMTPALLYLNTHAASLGLHAPWQFFYSTGALSSFLDNAPTAVAFYSVAQGLPVVEGATLVAGVPEALLKAISMGSVFFGALTYIGNGPNFMVKSIAERNGIKMPSFFGYMIRFSLVVLLPVYVVMQLIFI